MDLLICEGLRACSSVNCSHFVSHTFSMWICHRTSPAEVTHDYCIKTYLYPCKQIYRLKSWRHKFGVFVFWDQRVLSDKLCMCVCVCVCVFMRYPQLIMPWHLPWAALWPPRVSRSPTHSLPNLRQNLYLLRKKGSWAQSLF